MERGKSPDGFATNRQRMGRRTTARNRSSFRAGSSGIPPPSRTILKSHAARSAFRARMRQLHQHVAQRKSNPSDHDSRQHIRNVMIANINRRNAHAREERQKN